MKYLKHTAIFVVLLLWQGACSLKILPHGIVPSPVDVCLGISELITVGLPPGHSLGGHLAASLHRVALGFVAAAAIGIPMGLLMGWSKAVHDALRPIVEVMRPIPPLAWIPMAIMWFGIGLKSSTFIIFLGAFFPIVLNTTAGVTLVSPVFVEASLTLGLSRWDILTKVLAPGALPSVFTGVRVGLGIAWMTLVAAEFTGVKTGHGLGYMIMTARDIQRPDLILAGTATIGLVGFGIDSIILVLRRKVLRWL